MPADQSGGARSPKRNQLLEDLQDVAERALIDADVPKPVAAIAANALVDRLADYWGGQIIAFPRDCRWRLGKLELQMYEQFDGRNYDQLAQRYSYTVRGVRRLINRVRQRLQAEAQRDLFDRTPREGA
jgi:Mor family transcriptional regulator